MFANIAITINESLYIYTSIGVYPKCQSHWLVVMLCIAYVDEIEMLTTWQMCM